MLEKHYYTIDNLFEKKMIRMPIILLVSPRYKYLSGDAKVMYAMMLEYTRSHQPFFDTPKSEHVKIDSQMRYYFSGTKRDLMKLLTIQDELKFDNTLKELHNAELLTYLICSDDTLELYPLLYNIEAKERKLIDEFKLSVPAHL